MIPEVSYPILPDPEPFHNADMVRRQNAMDKRDVAILLMGLTGSGKSTFISLMTDQNVEVGHSLDSCTTTTAFYSFDYDETKTVHLIDTPGFDDTTRSDTEVLREIAGALSILYDRRIPILGMVYVHRISDTKMSGAAVKSLRIFEKLCGKQAFPHAFLATSMWDRIDQLEGGHELGKSREKWLREKPDFWGNMIERGARTKRLYGDMRSAKKVVDVLVREGQAVTLDIQRQMVDQGYSLEETTVGQYVNEEMNENLKRQQKQLDELRASLQEAVDDHDEDLAQELARQEKKYTAKLDASIAEVAKLRTNFEELANTKSEEYMRHINALEDERAYSLIRVEEVQPDVGSRRRDIDGHRSQRLESLSYETSISVSVRSGGRHRNVVGDILNTLVGTITQPRSSRREFVIASDQSQMARRAAQVATSRAISRRTTG